MANKIRTGARTFLNLMAKACKLSHLPGFRLGLAQILGPEEANTFFAAWDPVCTIVDLLVGTDNWFNKFDATNDDGDGEDTAGV